ncbi:hypothetical protein ANN_13432 [Periplaneta americana]|uniref:Uncharacterized protein n=1 Tax=Periplaneta americana TaxID=6978 RepID=A0ABQ8TLT5_PERAM|nr:hypothetical protein ANN_13432 [Periplaneta americana]
MIDGCKVILPVLLYGCETWTLTLREEHRFRVFENKVLRKIFGAKRDEVTGEWRKLHNTELHALYFSPDIIRNIKSRRLRWAGHVARMGESRNAYRVLVGRPEGKRPLGRPRRRWEDNIKMDLREVGYGDRDWINLAQDRDRWRAYVRAAMNLRTGSSQPEDVNQEKINIYLPTVDYFKAKYQLENIDVIGLLIGARGVIPKFFESFRKTFELPQTLTTDIITSANDNSAYRCSANNKSALHRYKPQVSTILGYAIERELVKSHGGWKSNTVAEGYVLLL